MVNICGPEFGAFFGATIMPLLAVASVTTSLIIGGAYMAGTALANPKLTLWGRTEAVQLVISMATVFVLLTIMNTFCTIRMDEVAGLFDLTAPPGNPDIYSAAQSYLNETAIYSHNALTVVRYHLEAYTTLSFFNAFICDLATGRIGWGCLFGYSGDTQQPLGGYGAHMAAMNIFFNGAIISHFMVLNFLFILLFVYKGFVFLFLPLGVFMRSMPYMRSFGSLFIALAMAFLVVYPFLLSILYLMRNTLLDAGTGFTPLPQPMSAYNEDKYPAQEGGGGVAQSVMGEEYLRACYFSSGGCGFGSNDLENPAGAIMFASNSLVAAVFFPSIALLATIASVSYIARLYGEDIDLSRITQLV